MSHSRATSPTERDKDTLLRSDMPEATYGATVGSIQVPDAEPTKPSFWRRACSKVGGVIKTGSVAMLSVAAAAPNMISGFFAATKTDANKPGFEFGEWFKALPGGKMAHSIANGASAAVVNTVMNMLFFPAAARRLKKVLPKTFRSGRDFIRNSVALLGGAAGAFSASGIAYASFAWLGMPAAIGAAALNFLIYFATRFVGITNTIKKFKHFANPTIRFQKRCVELLKYLKPEHADTLNAYIREHELNPSAENFQKLFEQINALCDEHGFDGVFRKPTGKEKIKKYLGIIFDLLLLAPILPSSFITFAQKGFDGVQMFDKLSGGVTIEGLNVWAKRAMGFVPGLVSTMFYGISAINLRPALTKTFHKIRKDKRKIIPAAVLLASNALSASAQEGIALGITNNKDNMFGLAPAADSALSQVYVGFAATGGGSTNTSANFTKYSESPAITDVITEPDAQGETSLTRTIDAWETREGKKDRITPEIARGLAELGMFSQPKATPRDYQHIPDGATATPRLVAAGSRAAV